jgi:hypothetical protein
MTLRIPLRTRPDHTLAFAARITDDDEVFDAPCQRRPFPAHDPAKITASPADVTVRRAKRNHRIQRLGIGR